MLTRLDSKTVSTETWAMFGPIFYFLFLKNKEKMKTLFLEKHNNTKKEKKHE